MRLLEILYTKQSANEKEYILFDAFCHLRTCHGHDVGIVESTISAANVYRINGVNIVNSMGQTIAPKKGFFSLGISIYANDNETWEDFGDNYKATDFDKATGWSAFLDQNTVGVFKSAINPANNSVWNLDYLDE